MGTEGPDVKVPADIVPGDLGERTVAGITHHHIPVTFERSVEGRNDGEWQHLASPGAGGTDLESGRFAAVPVQRPDSVVGVEGVNQIVLGAQNSDAEVVGRRVTGDVDDCRAWGVLGELDHGVGRAGQHDRGVVALLGRSLLCGRGGCRRHPRPDTRWQCRWWALGARLYRRSSKDKIERARPRLVVVWGTLAH